MKKYLLLIALSTIMLITLAACGSSEESEGTSGDSNESDSNDSAEETEYDLVEEGKFTFAASGEFRPFSMTDASGEMTGFDIDVAHAIAEELGLEPNPQKQKFASIVEGVKTNRFDAAVASHTITEERQQEVDFSTPYYYSGAQIFTRPDSDVETLEDLEGLEVALSKGSTYSTYAEEVTDNIKTYDSDVVALQSLAKGRHDAVITDFLTGKEASGEGLEIEAKEMIERSEQAVAVSKENEALLEEINAALETLREDGTLAEISEEYFGEDITTLPE
ncbi:amino acid ABC transporter substrate-binding protein, PAAT family [Halobacillus karajensis]|uniref:Sulfate starvation-induced protein 7 n=1 Tax=Halobacillus karajensis TaxID=195088 RepID=A0A024P6Z8_9BACI|nr:transporter substrate-binding domain-containing protein [Halobacillus karajensis]CDQ18196.1 Sulfate starvation-induced protein 7 [Halobacillus karajensis]CDQ24548.1 Sulfate starvation-induced protein 7 [Halobacillus karajensis]CDQ29205.1 Sulfate starvation-induced protein 7 [Halobacillus karajensis]SEH57434.1 amino acid ABC transporter substrate-binding protein, PAAT family [Halobacillus karajensis]